jgi:hypothetical protein
MRWRSVSCSPTRIRRVTTARSHVGTLGFVLEANGITADEAALALSAAKGLAGLKTRDVAAQTLRRLALSYGLRGIADACAGC